MSEVIAASAKEYMNDLKAEAESKGGRLKYNCNKYE